jgi:hypothetical protein
LTKSPCHPLAVERLIRLRSWRPHGWTATSIQQLELNSRGVDGTAHQAAERIDLADKVPLRRSTDGRIARHVRNGLLRERAQANVTSYAGCRIGCLDTGMTSAHDNHIESHRYLPMQKWSKM